MSVYVGVYKGIYIFGYIYVNMSLSEIDRDICMRIYIIDKCTYICICESCGMFVISLVYG